MKSQYFQEYHLIKDVASLYTITWIGLHCHLLTLQIGAAPTFGFFLKNPRIIPNKNQIQNCFLIILEYIVIFFALLTISSTLWGCKEEAPLKGSIKPSSRSREKMDLILPKQTHFDISLYLQISRVVIITKHISIHQIDSRRTTNREINRKFSLVLYSIKIIPYI